ncbi:MAG: hypothetical protein ACFE0O_05190 [Opitutales bacterium]
MLSYLSLMRSGARQPVPALLWFAALLGLLPALSAQTLVNVDLNGGGTQYDFSGAAAVGQTGDQWNIITGTSTSSPLVDTQGSATTITFQAGEQGAFENGEDPSSGASWGGRRYPADKNDLFRDYKFNNHTDANSRNFVIGGLDSTKSYDLYFYGSVRISGANFGGTFTVDGVTKESDYTLSGNAPATLTEGHQYVVFRNIASGTGTNGNGPAASNEIRGTWGSAPTNFTAISSSLVFNGLQISAIPEPEHAALILVIPLAILLIRRRRTRIGDT